ncbi:hypothetical protein [Herbaspirillum sp. RV1423]|uniref:hypothetical protein n=1 Tax=Herbaspirillum sp. RV1423 TaxID=1443993 RepID=UPI0004B02D4A|nr:hypothetical protein [Herbaspirillum sp. RV1423]
MATATDKQPVKSEVAPQNQEQASSSGQRQSPHLDPLGRPLHQGSPRFTDQQAGGDLTGDESDARDDNFIEAGSGQTARDVTGHADELPAASAELLRCVAVVKSEVPMKAPAIGQREAEPEPDGTEDPGSSADDGLAPRKTDGSASEQH